MGRKGKKNPRKQSTEDLEDSKTIHEKKENPKDLKDMTKSMEISTYFSRVFPNPIEERSIQKCIYCSCDSCIKLESIIYMWLAEMVLEVIMNYEGIRYIECLFCTESLNIFEKDQLLWHNKRQKQLIKGTCGISSGLCEKVANKIATEEASMIRERYFQVQVSQHVCLSQASSSNSNNESKSTERQIYQ